MNVSTTRRFVCAFSCLALGFAIPAQATGEANPQDAAKKVLSDREQVHAAAMDYVEAIYKAQPKRITKSVATDLDKVGILRQGNKQTFAAPEMTYDQLFKLAGSYNKTGESIPADAVKTVEVLGVLPAIAVVKLTAAWGIDYMQMRKVGTSWRIQHIAWQRAPRPRKEVAADRKGIHAAIEGYTQAFYQKKPEWITAHVAPSLAKIGLSSGKWSAMSFAQLKALAGKAFASPPKGAPMKITILDCADNIATAKLEALWGLDFINLIRTDAGWKIRQVVWQPHPPKKRAAK